MEEREKNQKQDMLPVYQSVKKYSFLSLRERFKDSIFHVFYLH